MFFRIPMMFHKNPHFFHPNPQKMGYPNLQNLWFIPKGNDPHDVPIIHRWIPPFFMGMSMDFITQRDHKGPQKSTQVLRTSVPGAPCGEISSPP